VATKRIFGKFFNIILVIFVFLFFIASFVNYTSLGKNNFASPKIVVINMEGIILDSDKFLKIYRSFEDNPKIKGYILRINSPGGAVAPSQEIYKIIRKIKKPFYVSMGTLAASGGYYIASAADKIYALDGTLTGSIGVIMKFSNFSQLYDKIGIKFETIKSGKFKDIGASGRDLTDEERDILQSVIDDVYESFINDILNARKIDKKQLLEYADGRIITGKKAKEIGLVDEIGDFYDVVLDLKKRIGIPDVDLYFYEEDKNPLTTILGSVKYIKNLFASNDSYQLYYLNDKLIQ